MSDDRLYESFSRWFLAPAPDLSKGPGSIETSHQPQPVANEYFPPERRKPIYGPVFVKSDRNRRVIAMRVSSDMTLREIGDEFGITGARVAQILDRANVPRKYVNR